VLRHAERQAETTPESGKPSVQAGQAVTGDLPLAAPKERVGEWDLIKAVMLFFVIVLHIGRNGWLKGGLSDGDQTFFLMLAPFPMPAFAFISGVFGASVGRSTMLKTLCYTLGTFLLAKMLGGMIVLTTPGPRSFEDIRCVGFLVLWYLKSLAVWRFTLTPLFHYTSKRNVPALVPFVGVFLVCHVLRHLGLPHWAREWIYFAPYYAQGLLLSASRWSELLADRRCTFVAYAFILVWCASLAMPSVRDWNDVACAHGFSQCPNSHWPATMKFTRRALSVSSFMTDVRIYASQDALSMAVMWIVAAFAAPLQAKAPRLAAVVFGIGTRTLYGYVLHFLLFLQLGVRMGVSFPHMDSWIWCMISMPLAMQALFVFCSSLTGLLFTWVIMPFWMLRIFGLLKT